LLRVIDKDYSIWTNCTCVASGNGGILMVSGTGILLLTFGSVFSLELIFIIINFFMRDNELSQRIVVGNTGTVFRLPRNSKGGVH
jgi:hypothetical protein